VFYVNVGDDDPRHRAEEIAAIGVWHDNVLYPAGAISRVTIEEFHQMSLAYLNGRIVDLNSGEVKG